ncbi:YraN family protein [Tropicimonas sp. TH_r6]|uniref:YraN family protein n=1 Tax=Tropicimonas sp. TH_r6 TaxID=3082085 RepID=UPI002953B530|nr:YraN family protein [Tropicimonas sp. TH_r6]MDV7142217.1 YraN family protein [Tropicimonas sp. TH_r6]
MNAGDASNGKAMQSRRARGSRAHLTGQAAEEIAERFYRDRQMRVLERRWRGTAGEVDLVIADGDRLIFVEVKASEDFARAAAQLSERQMARIYAAASEYIARMPAGQDTELRFDVALVDGQGRIEVLEAAFGL